MPGWAARALDDLPLAADAEPGAPWYPLQHAFGFTASARTCSSRESADTSSSSPTTTFESTWLPSHFEGVPRLL